RLGQSMEEGTILQWFKREGDEIRAGEPLLEVMSDKANFEVEATSNGVLRKILITADETVDVNTPIAIIGNATEPIDDLALSPSTNGATEFSNPTIASSEPAAAPLPPVAAITQTQSGAPAVSPRARRLADEHSIPISSLGQLGSGPGGRIIEKDIK